MTRDARAGVAYPLPAVDAGRDKTAGLRERFPRMNNRFGTHWCGCCCCGDRRRHRVRHRPPPGTRRSREGPNCQCTQTPADRIAPLKAWLLDGAEAKKGNCIPPGARPNCNQYAADECRESW